MSIAEHLGPGSAGAQRKFWTWCPACESPFIRVRQLPITQHSSQTGAPTVKEYSTGAKHMCKVSAWIHIVKWHTIWKYWEGALRAGWLKRETYCEIWPHGLLLQVYTSCSLSWIKGPTFWICFPKKNIDTDLFLQELNCFSKNTYFFFLICKYCFSIYN